MTLIIATKGKDHIILGADSRSVNDENGSRIITDIHEKLVQLNKYCAILIAGNGEKGTYLIEELKKVVKPTDNVFKIANKLREISEPKFRSILNFVPVDSDYYPELAFIVAGFNKPGKNPKEPKLYILRSTSAFAIGEKRDYTIIGKDSISKYIFAKHYEKNMTANDRFELIVKCLFETEKYDGEAGGDFHTAMIDGYGFKKLDNKSYRDGLELEKLKKIIQEA